jgi:gamma-glutamylcyclotransferase (GGCT)/AIG2-like uncharacterized protein YtfP
MNNPGVYKLFVYGSLRSAFKSHAYEYISRFFSFDGIGKVNGKLFDMGTYPAAVPAADTFIVGELYTIRNEEEFSWAIGQLDDYEGVSSSQTKFNYSNANWLMFLPKMPKQWRGSFGILEASRENLR